VLLVYLRVNEINIPAAPDLGGAERTVNRGNYGDGMRHRTLVDVDRHQPPIPVPAGSAGRARQRVLALFLPVAAVLYIGGEAVSPKGTDQPITTVATALKELPIAARHSAQLYLASFLVLFGLGALAVSYAAIATLARDRGSALAIVAALLGGIGAFCGAIVNVLAYPSLAAAATAHVSSGAAAKLLTTAFNSGFGHGFTYLYFASEFLAPLLMAIALWRSRNVPRWLVALFFAGLVVAQLMGSYGPIVVLPMLPFAAAMFLLAARIWPAAARPAGHRQEPATVPVSSP